MTFRRTRCPHCKGKLEAGQRIHPDCVDPWVASQLAKKEREEAKRARALAKIDRALVRQRKAELVPLRKLLATAQDAFNEYIRLRDAHKPCVSCLESNPPMKPGGQWDAGHFLSRGSHPELRFNEDNCHKQCKSCNGGSGKFSHKARTVAQNYEAELPNRIGHERLAILKGPHPVVKWTREQVLEITQTYRAKVRELKKENV